MDEVCFTKTSFVNRDWSRKHDNIKVDQARVYRGFRAVAAAVSMEKGIEPYTISEKAFKGPTFIDYLTLLKTKNKGKIAIFMDNLGVHKSPEVWEFYEENDIMPLFNVAYSPEFNGIENVFAQIKRTYCKARLHKLANDEEWDMVEEINTAFKKVRLEVVQACLRKSNAELRDLK